MIKNWKDILNNYSYPKVATYKTILDGNDDFIEIENNIICKFCKLIDKLENDDNVIMCTRGDSRRKDFMTITHLKLFFIVGQKANVFNCKTPQVKQYEHATHLDETNLKHEITDLIKEVNAIVDSKPNDHSLSGKIDIYNAVSLEGLDLETLNKFKILLISFLHNNGKMNFKNISPFLSMTYGTEKFQKAYSFALSHRKKNGYIFLYCLSKTLSQYSYVVTKQFTKFLNDIGIKWYPDNHNEIMLMNGMYPHYILGVYRIENKQISEFIMNPALYLELKHSELFDIHDGLPINQKNFIQLAKEIGYEQFYFTDGKNSFISDLNMKCVPKCINIKF